MRKLSIRKIQEKLYLIGIILNRLKRLRFP